MSDPAKSVSEIEDVLASIRRLVSEGQGAPLVAVPGSTAPRLVLTAAQRITEPDDPWAPVPSAAPATEATSEDPAWGLEDRLSDWGEIEGSAEEAIEDAIAEQSAPDLPGPAAEARSFEPVADGDADAPGFEPETGDTNWPDAGATRALRDLAMVRGHAGAEEAPAATGHDADGNGPVADTRPTASVGEPGQDAPAVDAMVLAEAVGADDAAPVTGEDEAARLSGEDEAARLSGEDEAARLSGEDASTGGTQDDPPPRESPMTDDMAIGADPVDEDVRVEPKAAEAPRRVVLRPVAVRLAAKAEGEPTKQAEAEPTKQAFAPADDQDVEDLGDEPDVEDLGDEPQPFTFPETEEGLLDEETLRQIVAEVVREELQGVLGQRITRNVRKMVRREVRLALAAQDLE